MTVRPAVCQRQHIRGHYNHDAWWRCDQCEQSWNERDVSPNWRPLDCPERPGKDNQASMSAYRDKKNHD